MLTIRLALTLLVMALVIWLLLAGYPLGAAAVALAAVWLRRRVESRPLLLR